MEDEDWILEQLESSPVVDVLGIVKPNGVSGVRLHDEDLWTAWFTFDAWRIIGFKIHIESLNIRQEVTEKDLHRLQSIVMPCTVVWIKAQVIKSKFGIDEGYLKSFVGVYTSDPELNHHAEELQKPVTLEDQMFGIFTLDRGTDCYTAEVVWDGELAYLYIFEIEEVQEALKTAYAIYQEKDEWNSRIKNYAVQELLLLKNESWIDDDEVELSPDEFKARMVLESITVDPNGSFEFWYDDGGIFWGHSIAITGNLSEGLTCADICG